MKHIPTTWFRLLLLSWMLLVARPTQAQGWQADWLTPVSDAPHMHYQNAGGTSGPVRIYQIRTDAAGNSYAFGTGGIRLLTHHAGFGK